MGWSVCAAAQDLPETAGADARTSTAVHEAGASNKNKLALTDQRGPGVQWRSRCLIQQVLPHWASLQLYDCLKQGYGLFYARWTCPGPVFEPGSVTSGLPQLAERRVERPRQRIDDRVHRSGVHPAAPPLPFQELAPAGGGPNYPRRCPTGQEPERCANCEPCRCAGTWQPCAASAALSACGTPDAKGLRSSAALATLRSERRNVWWIWTTVIEVGVVPERVRHYKVPYIAIIVGWIERKILFVRCMLLL
jgi:hypothetical protein